MIEVVRISRWPSEISVLAQTARRRRKAGHSDGSRQGRLKRAPYRLAALVAALAVLSACASPQAKETRLLESGKKYIEAKDYSRAILQFKNAARATPADPEPHFQLALSFLAMGDVKAAAGNLQQAITLDSKHVGARVKLAALMTVNRDLNTVRKGEELAKSALDLSPDNEDALSTLAVAELRLGKPEDAEEHLIEALKKFPEHFRSSVTLATIRLQRKDFAGAEGVLRKAAADAPKSAAPAVALGRLYVLLGKWAEAHEQFDRAVELDPKNGAALLDLAALQVRAGQRDKAEQTYKRLSILPDSKFKPLHATFLFQNGKRDAAIAEFEKLVKENPKDRTLRTDLVSAYLEISRISEGEKIIANALKQNPKDADALLQRAELYFKAGKSPEAQADLAQVINLRPESAEAHFLLGKVHQANGEMLTHRQELSEAVRLNPNLLSARLELAQSLIAGKSAKAALDIMNQTPNGQRRLAPAIVQRNWALYALGDDVELRKGIDQGLAVARTSDLLVQDGLLKQRRGDSSGALSAWGEVLKGNPENVGAVERLAQSYADQNQTAKAVEAVRKYASDRPKSPPMQLLLGKWLLKTGDRAGARAAFSAAKAADPTLPAADLRLAQVDITEGKLDSARQTLLAVVNRNGRNAGSRLMLGLLEEQAGNQEAAVEHYRKVLEIFPNNVVALNNLAYLLAAHGKQPDEALKLAQQAKEIAPDQPMVEDTLGWALYQKGIYPSAVVHLEEAVSKSDRNPVTRYHLAMAYLKAGDRNRGLQALETALRMDPKTAEAKMALETLRDLEQQGNGH
jgi:tetratricopeptide (TPR) repeat protein